MLHQQLTAKRIAMVVHIMYLPFSLNYYFHYFFFPTYGHVYSVIDKKKKRVPFQLYASHIRIDWISHVQRCCSSSHMLIFRTDNKTKTIFITHRQLCNSH